MSLDETQLLARFREGFDTKSNQVLTLNKLPAVKADESKVWCRFSVSPGDKLREQTGVDPFYTQLGGVFLQVFIPKTLGIKAGDEMIGKFENLFLDWVSPDELLRTGRLTRSTSEKDSYYQVTLRFAYVSMRKRG